MLKSFEVYFVHTVSGQTILLISKMNNVSYNPITT